MTDDPCDDWPVFVMKGRLCKLRREESGVSPSFWNDPWFLSSKYKVVETSFIPYAYWETYYAEPIDKPREELPILIDLAEVFRSLDNTEIHFEY